jgi:hypothetical protein
MTGGVAGGVTGRMAGVVADIQVQRQVGGDRALDQVILEDGDDGFMVVGIGIRERW